MLADVWRYHVVDSPLASQSRQGGLVGATGTSFPRRPNGGAPPEILLRGHTAAARHPASSITTRHNPSNPPSASGTYPYLAVSLPASAPPTALEHGFPTFPLARDVSTNESPLPPLCAAWPIPRGHLSCPGPPITARDAITLTPIFLDRVSRGEPRLPKSFTHLLAPDDDTCASSTPPLPSPHLRQLFPAAI